MYRVLFPPRGALPRWAAAVGLLASLALAACDDSGVGPAPVGSVAVTPATLSIIEGDTVRLTYVARDGRGDPVTGRPVTWMSSDTTVLAVGADGLVRARRAGRAKVSATVAGHVGFSMVDVLAAAQFPRLDSTQPASIMEGEQTSRIVVRGKNFVEGAQIDWSGTPLPSIFVGSTELWLDVPAARFETVGTATLKVVNPTPTGGVSNAAVFTVTRAPVAQVSVAPDSLRLGVGKSVQVDAIVRGPAGRVLQGRTVTWSATPASVVTVDGQGRVVGVGAGRGQVSATVEGVTRTITVDVAAAHTPVRWVLPNPPENYTVVGVRTQLSAKVLGAGGEELPGRKVVWWVESPDIASIDAAGTALGLKAGKTRVLASSEGVEGWATLEVRVIPAGPVHSYDLRHEGFGIRPILGDTLWTMPDGSNQRGALVLDSASVTIDYATSRYTQHFVAAVAVGFERVGAVVWVDSGTWGYDFGGGLVFTSTSQPGLNFRAFGAGPGALRIKQAVRGRTLEYLYLVR